MCALQVIIRFANQEVGKQLQPAWGLWPRPGLSAGPDWPWCALQEHNRMQGHFEIVSLTGTFSVAGGSAMCSLPEAAVSLH